MTLDDDGSTVAELDGELSVAISGVSTLDVADTRSGKSGAGRDDRSSVGMRVASADELSGSTRREGFGAGGGIDGRMGFGRWRGGASCCRRGQATTQPKKRAMIPFQS